MRSLQSELGKPFFWASWYARCHLVCAFVLVTLLSQIYVEFKQEDIASNQGCCTQSHLQYLQLGGIRIELENKYCVPMASKQRQLTAAAGCFVDKTTKYNKTK